MLVYNDQYDSGVWYFSLSPSVYHTYLSDEPPLAVQYLAQGGKLCVRFGVSTDLGERVFEGASRSTGVPRS